MPFTQIRIISSYTLRVGNSSDCDSVIGSCKKPVAVGLCGWLLHSDFSTIVDIRVV